MEGIRFGVTPPSGNTRPLNGMGTKDVAAGGKGVGFSRILDEVNRLQGDALQAAEQLSTGQSGDIHQAVLASVRAELGVLFMVQVRDRLVQGLQEILRMQM